MRGLAAGTYDLSYGVTMPRFENIPNLVFVPLIAARYLVYARIDHPLRAAIASGRLSEAKLHGFGWIKYYYEYDFDPSQWIRTGRTYVVTTNTLLSTLELVRETDLLLNTSESFLSPFTRHDVVPLGPDPTVVAQNSGAHHLGHAAMKPAAAQSFEFCQSRVAGTRAP